jgi:hypothetical protein
MKQPNEYPNPLNFWLEGGQGGDVVQQLIQGRLLGSIQCTNDFLSGQRARLRSTPKEADPQADPDAG